MKGQIKRIYVSAFAISCILAVMSVAAWGLDVDPVQQAQQMAQVSSVDAASSIASRESSTSVSNFPSNASSSSAKSASSGSGSASSASVSSSSPSKSASKSSSASSRQSKDAPSADDASKSSSSHPAQGVAKPESEADGEETAWVEDQDQGNGESDWAEEHYGEPEAADYDHWPDGQDDPGFEDANYPNDYDSYQDTYTDASQFDNWAQPDNAGQTTVDPPTGGENTQSASQAGSQSQQPTASQPANTESADQAPPQAERVWVEPVYEQRLVHPDTGTRYCGGVNNGAEGYDTCTESWHGTKEETYNLWHDHWKAYVQRRTAEEAEQGRAYVCDHVHDDSMWVPDEDYYEEVLVQEGYWKE